MELSVDAEEHGFFLYEHLGRVLSERGVAVLRYDRRPSEDGSDTPFQRQADDALAAIRLLRERIGAVPIGVWGISQGGWAAPVTAERYPHEVAFVIAVSGSGLSPAQQMRYAATEQLRLHGFGEAEQREALHVRMAAEDREREPAQRELASIVDEQWFPTPICRRNQVHGKYGLRTAASLRRCRLPGSCSVRRDR